MSGRSWRLVAALVVALVAVGVAFDCASGKEGANCSGDNDCDYGFYCLASRSICTYDCRSNSDCVSNICDIRGRCVVLDAGVKADAGDAGKDGGGDAGSDAGGAADAGPDAGGANDGG